MFLLKLKNKKVKKRPVNLVLLLSYILECKISKELNYFCLSTKPKVLKN